MGISLAATRADASRNRTANGSVVDPNLALGLPPDRKAHPDLKARFTISRFAAQNDHHVGFFKTWTKNLNFLIGEHWRSTWDGTSLSWNPDRDLPTWRQQPVTNLVFAVYRSILAKLQKQKPKMEVVPPCGSSKDREAAELGNAILEYLWRLLKISTKVPLLCGWALVTSLGYLRVGYDPFGGPTKPRTIPVSRRKGLNGPPEEVDPNTGLPTSGNGSTPGLYEWVEVACDENGEPYRKPDGTIDFDRQPDLERWGEADLQVVSPLCVRLNPEATSHEDATEMMVATLWPRVKAAKHFGVKEEELGGMDESAEMTALYTDLVSATAAGFPRSWRDRSSNWGVSQEAAIGNRTLVIEHYFIQDDEYPDGRHWITAGKKLVWPPQNAQQAEASQHKVVGAGGSAEESDELTDDQTPDKPVDPRFFADAEAPLPFGFWPPLIPLIDTPIPGQPAGVPLLGQVVPINEQLNTLDGRIIEHDIMMTTGGAWFVDESDKGIQITSEPAQIIASKGMTRKGSAYAPFQAEMRALAPEIYAERDKLNGKVQTVAGLSASDISQKSEGTPSGRALLVTQETSDSTLTPFLFALEIALEEAGRRLLKVVQTKYREERTMSIKSADGRWLFKSFKGADLRDGHDVRVEIGSMFPWSKSAQWDTKLAMLQALIPTGVFNDPGTGKIDDARLARFLDVGAPGLAAFSSDENPDLMEIQREHSMFENYDPGPDGDHQIPQVAFWQNQAIHLREHYNFMKKDFERYRGWHPAAQRAFQTHMMLHQAAIEDAAARMMPEAPAGAAGGGGPAAAVPGGPAAPAPAPGPAGPNLHLVAPGQGNPRGKLTKGDFNSIKPERIA